VKWIAIALFLAAVPMVAAWLRTNPRKAPWIWGLLTFLPFVIGPWHLVVATYATPFWSGYVKGWEISLLDSLALGVLLGTRGTWPRPKLLLPLLAYILVVMLAVFQARFGFLAWSYVVQLARILIVFLAVARVTFLEKGERAILTGLLCGLIVQALYALLARAGGALQTGGSLGHQNLLGFVSHMAVMPAFALFLAGRWRGIALAGTLAGLIVVILTASRATIAFSGIGLIMTLLLSVSIRFSGRKAIVGMAGVALLLASFPLAQATLDQRLQAQRSTFFKEDLERVAFEKAALSMLHAKPMGVGPNHYVFIANTEGYSARAGVHWGVGSRSTNVHNSYLLMAVETGYIGLAAFLILLASAIFYAFGGAVRFRRQPGSEVLIGVGCGLVALSLHAFFEWMLVVFPAQYLFAGSLGLIAGLRSRYASASRSSQVTMKASSDWRASPVGWAELTSPASQTRF
jgi:O-antigen ligase